MENAGALYIDCFSKSKYMVIDINRNNLQKKLWIRCHFANSLCIASAYSLIRSTAPELCTELKVDQLCHENNRSLPQVANPWKDPEGATSNQNYCATKLMHSFKNSAYTSMFYEVFKGILYTCSTQAWSPQWGTCSSENQNTLRPIEKDIIFFRSFPLNRSFVLSLPSK